MSKRIGLTGIILLFYCAVLAQKKLNYIDVDKQSYELFEANKWTELIAYAAEARDQGIDFFYLQVRTGIAWYNQGKYHNATPWFLKAYSSNKSIDWLQEYVYYSLLFSGRQPETVKYAPYFSNETKKKIGFKDNGITRFTYETGYGLNPDFESLKTHDYSTEVNLGDDYGEGYFLKNYSFHSIDISHRVAPNLTFNHNVTYIGVNREAVVDWGTQTTSQIRINQFQYYINPVWVIGKKVNISPSLNLIFGKNDIYAGYLNFDSTKGYGISKKGYSDAIFSTSIWSNFGNFSPGLEINWGNINNSKVTQLSSWITYYPTSNSNFYITPKVYFKSGTGSFGWNAFGVSGGAQLGKIHFYGNYIMGNMENFIESAGSVVDNFPGKSDQKFMGSVFLPLGKKHQMFIRYINQSLIEKYQVYTEGFKTNTLEYNYLKHTITAGISWNF